jgi:hypothetical protein
MKPSTVEWALELLEVTIKLRNATDAAEGIAFTAAEAKTLRKALTLLAGAEL